MMGSDNGGRSVLEFPTRSLFPGVQNRKNLGGFVSEGPEANPTRTDRIMLLLPCFDTILIAPSLYQRAT